jgi:hypothetical protein
MWQQQGRDAVFDLDAQGGSVRIGDGAWVEALSPASAEAVKSWAVGDGSYAPYGHLAASRTSNGGGIGRIAIALQDNKFNKDSHAWADYWEVHVTKDSHPENYAAGLEGAVITKRRGAPVTPYNINQPGAIWGYRIGAGKPGLNSVESSAIGTFCNVEGPANTRSVFQKGWVVDTGALERDAKGRAEVFSVAKGQAFRWYAPDGQVAFEVVSDIDNSHFGVGIRATEGAIHFYNLRTGDHQFSFNLETGVPYFGTKAFEPSAPAGNVIGKMRMFVGGRECYVPVYGS